MFNKDVTHSKMRRRIENPRVLLLDCPLEYKKGEVSVMAHQSHSYFRYLEEGDTTCSVMVTSMLSTPARREGGHGDINNMTTVHTILRCTFNMGNIITEDHIK